jgi:hypothetical protein
MAMNEQAATAFTVLLAKINTQLDLLKEGAENHFEVDADSVSWGNVGDLENITQQLQNIVEFVST